MKILKVVCENEVNVVPDVVKWNSWDGEHLRTVHSAYEDPILLLSKKNESLFVDRFKIPIFGIRVKAMVYTFQMDEQNQISYTLTPFFLAKNTITLVQLEEKKTLVRVTYEFSGNYFQRLLFPFIKIMIKKWNKVVWNEDLPLKLRRQKALEYGFVDFIGLPEKIENRMDISNKYRTELPVKRALDIREVRHPFFVNLS